MKQTNSKQKESVEPTKKERAKTNGAATDWQAEKDAPYLKNSSTYKGEIVGKVRI